MRRSGDDLPEILAAGRGQVRRSGIGTRCLPVADWQYGCGAGATCDFAHAESAGCAAGACVLGTCHAGWANCNGSDADGCETDLSSPSNCGACGASCAAGMKCAPGVGCVDACAPPATDCGDRCADLFTDPRACGACTNRCADPAGVTPTCAAGKCGTTCPAGSVRCGGACVDTTSDPNHCGACDATCTGVGGGPAACVAGTCACANGRALCGASCVDVAFDMDNCGACGSVCRLDTCVHGACTTFASMLVASNLGSGPADFVADDTGLYFVSTDAGTVTRIPPTGPAQVLVSGARGPWSVAIDDGYVYWTERLGAAIMRAPKAGGAATLISIAAEPAAVAIDSSGVYWTNLADATLRRAPKAGGTSVTLSARTAPLSPTLAIYADGLVFQSSSYVLSKLPLAGGPETFFADGFADYARAVPEGIALMFVSTPEGWIAVSSPAGGKRGEAMRGRAVDRCGAYGRPLAGRQDLRLLPFDPAVAVTNYAKAPAEPVAADRWSIWTRRATDLYRIPR